MQVLEDKCSGCLSVIHELPIKDYLDLAIHVYKNQGGLEGQRAKLKTKTAIRIRERMVQDIGKGAILPPLVIGAVVNDKDFLDLSNQSNQEDIISILLGLDSDCLSIIDGMQRTTAILEARKEHYIDENPVRLEIWISKTINSLVYRMLVLNTGQVPWEMRRQLETVYKPILHEIKEKASRVKPIGVDDGERRKSFGEYQADKIIESFLIFSSRKVHIDLKERVAEDFARMHATEATANERFIDHFAIVLNLMAEFDKQFSRCEDSVGGEGKFKIGKDVFSSTTTGYGFVAAASVYIYGPPGFEYDKEKVENKFEEYVQRMTALVESMNLQTASQLREYLDLITLSERTSRRSGKVGEFEREFFFSAFKTMIEYADELESLTPCWMAH
ncbi:hypothetical protein [Marinobacter sp. MIT932201]|uniref:hypothetical protein n=1 Tax=Marinobacter sp. MIT932201 TaxID=3096995 RepID=UPI00399AC607